jgi:hypothetical protein
MQVATIKGSAVIGLSVVIGVGLIAMAGHASGGGTSESSTSAGHWAPTSEPCEFPGSNTVGPTIVADFSDGVSSDGRGPYVRGQDGVIDSRAGQEGALTIFDRADSVRNIRSFSVNLNKPVPGGGGVPLGIANSGNPSGFITQRGMVGDAVQNLMDIPVGQTEKAAMMHIAFHINGRGYLLQMGPQASGHCIGGKNLVHGTGTSRGTITRVSATKWAMDLPEGSIGRLFDMQSPQRQPGERPQSNNEHAVDKGLYYVHLHYEIGN